MKKIYFAGLLAFMLSGYVNAQSEHPLQNQQRIPQQFQQSFMKQQMAQRHAENVTALPRTTIAPLASSQRSGMDNSALQFLTRRYAPKGDNSQGSIPLLSKMRFTVDGETQRTRLIKERNEYGLPTYEVVTLKDGSIVKEVRHTYEMGPQGYWTSWTTEEKMPDGNWLKTQRKERDINEQKQLVANREYKLNADSTKLVPIIEEEMVYNMDRREIIADGAPVYSNVTFTKTASYDNDGNIEFYREFVWNDDFENYLKVHEVTSYSKTIGELEGNKFTETEYRENYEGEWYPSDQFIKFSDGGFIRYQFEENGDTTFVWGNYLSWKDNTPSKGIHTIVRNERIRGEWVANKRYTVEGLSDQRKRQEGVPLVVKQETYDADSNEWIPTNNFTINQVSDNIVSIADNNGLRHYRFNHLDCNIFDEKNRIYYDNENQTYLCKIIDTPTSALYRQCNSKHEEIRTFIVNIGDRISPNFQSERIVYLHERAFPTSKPIPELELQYINCDGEMVRNEMVCNEKRQLVKRTEWTTLKNGKTFVTNKYNGDFDDDGYKITQVSYTIENGEKAVVSQTTTETYKELPTGECSQEIITCNGKGEIVAGERNVCDANSMMKSYTYSTETQDFELKNEAAGIVIEYLEDGSEVNIERKLDENGKLVNNEKVVFNKSDDTEERYSWNAEANEWVGRSKEKFLQWSEKKPEIYRHKPEAESLSPDEDLIVPMKTDKDKEGYISCHEKISYQWNQEKKTWEIREMSQSKFVKIDENNYLFYSKSDNQHSKHTEKHYITTNAKNQLSQLRQVWQRETTSREDPNKKEIFTSENIDIYTYDDRGMTVADDFIFKENNVVRQKGKILYEYVDFSFNPTAISDVKVVDNLQITGRNITAANGALITVYDMSGRCLQRAEGQLTLPSSGLYIVKCGDRSTKVMCR